MLTEKEKLERLTQLGVELNHIRDLDLLMEKILTESRMFVNADAGSIYIIENDRLHFTYTQNDTKCSVPGEKLIYSTFSMPIDQKSLAGYVTLTGDPLNLPDVSRIDPTAPYSFSRKFDEVADYHTVSVLTIPLKTAEGGVLGVIQVINAKDEAGKVVSFSDTNVITMKNFAGIASVTLERARMTRDILLRMIRMAELRDPRETGAHVNRVASFSIELYEKWALKKYLSRKEIDRNRDILRMAAMLHDVGKVGISDTILKKPDRLNDEEYRIMKEHSLMGAHLFNSSSEFDRAAVAVALNHHEKWNGTGYPGHINIQTGNPLPGYALPDGRARGKKGEEIPIFGRIVALADVYDALSSKRVYKSAWDEDRVLDIIEKEKGLHFDPELVDLLFDNLDIMRSIQQRYTDDT